MTHRNVEYRGVLSGDVVDFANQARAANSDQFLFASVNDARIEQLAQEFRNMRPAMTMRGFGRQSLARFHTAGATGSIPVPPTTIKIGFL
ncbi:MAG: hypothetical protein ACJ8R9_17875 [Steroidobacteraceae bacterium]